MTGHLRLVRTTAVLAAIVTVVGMAAGGANAEPAGGLRQGPTSPGEGAVTQGASTSAGATPTIALENPASATEALWAVPSSGWTANEEYRDRTYIWTDQVFDDRGAGGASYPSVGDPYMRNAADLVEVRLRSDGQGLVVGARLNTMLDPAVPIVAVGISDPSMEGTAEPWPGAGVQADGVRWVLTLEQGKTTVTDLAQQTSQNHAPPVIRDGTDEDHRALENTLTAVIPWATLGGEARRTLGVHAVAGVHDPAAEGWFGSPAVYDAAFFTPTKFDNWERGEQTALLESGDITVARGSVDLSVEERAAMPKSGQAQTRIYRPTIEMKTGEGIEPNRIPAVQAAGQRATVDVLGNFYKGLFLPYSVWVPAEFETLPRPLPLFLALHGVGGNHTDHLFPFWQSDLLPRDVLAIGVLGRSEYGYYQAEAALDVLEALEDAKATLPVDDDRVYLSGFSMGGLGTYTLATQRPDLFAAAFPIAGPGAGSDFLWPAPAAPVIGKAREYVTIHRMGSFGRELLDNALNLPFRIFMATIEQYVPVTYSEGDIARWEELGYDYDAVLFLQRQHKIVPEWQGRSYGRAREGCTQRYSHPGCDLSIDPGELVRDANPARVVYKALPKVSWHAGISEKLVFDGAYWVDGMVVRDQTFADDFGRIDVTSHALAEKRRVPDKVLPPALHTYEPSGGDQYKFQGRRWKVDPAIPSNGFDIGLENLAAVTLDAARMQLDVDQPIMMTATGDGPTALTLLGDWTDGAVVQVLRDGQVIASAVAQDGRVTVDFTPGERATYTITTP
jgi:pimeloyl-ACP methyl ester carboxylesterase